MKLVKQGKVYHARFRANAKGSGKPKWKKITTHQTTKSEAKKVLANSNLSEIERAAVSGHLSHEIANRILTGRKRLGWDDALKAFEEYLQAASHSSRTLEAYLDNMRLWIEWLAESKMTKRDRERMKGNNHVEDFKVVISKVQDVSPLQIEPGQVTKWVNNGGSVGTRKYRRTVIKMFYRFLIAKGWAVANPAALVGIDYDSMSHEQKEKKEKTPLTEKQVNLLLTTSDDLFWRFATLCAWENGLRLGDICNLEWASFGTPGKLIVWTGKTDERLELDMSARLTGLLSAIPVTDSRFVFPDQRQTVNDKNKRAALSVQFKRLCNRCGFEGHFHLLRHAAATNRAKNEMSDVLEIIKEIGLEKARKLLGHKRAKTTVGYVH